MPSKDFAILSVSQLTHHIKEQLESSFPHLEVRGEISNFKCQSSGHLYFSIKDAASQLPCVMFRGKAAHLKKVPRDGDQVIICGSINVYTPRGYYQLMASTLRFSGTGDLLLLIEQLKNKLSELGWFEQSRKKPFPLLPQKIALITSPTGAVVRDILHVLQRRHPGFSALICPVLVQGKEAPLEICSAIELVNRFDLADAIILARGGGSIEDLMPFNSEKVLEAIYKSRIPLMSAIGHETDTTLSDLVADQRAPTPSAAAELILIEKRQLLLDLRQIRQSMLKPLLAQIKGQRKMLIALHRHPWLSDPLRHLASHWQRLDDLLEQTSMTWRSKLALLRAHLERLRAILLALNPLRQLEKRGSELRRIFQLLFASARALATKRSAQLLQNHSNLEKIGPLICARARARFDALAALTRLIEMWRSQKARNSARIQQLKDLLKARDPHHLIKQGYAIVYHRASSDAESRAPLTKVEQAQRAKQLTIVLSNGSIAADVCQSICP